MTAHFRTRTSLARRAGGDYSEPNHTQAARRVKQDDLFAALEAEAKPRPYEYKPDAENIRRELRGVVAKARASATEPWDAHEFGYWRTVLPQMSRWLPEEERAELIREFEAEVARLTAA
jgi:hypothetical protein